MPTLPAVKADGEIVDAFEQRVMAEVATAEGKPGDFRSPHLGHGISALPVFDDTPSNPTEAMVMQAAEQYRREGCDGLIAVGGGWK